MQAERQTDRITVTHTLRHADHNTSHSVHWGQSNDDDDDHDDHGTMLQYFINYSSTTTLNKTNYFTYLQFTSQTAKEKLES